MAHILDACAWQSSLCERRCKYKGFCVLGYDVFFLLKLRAHLILWKHLNSVNVHFAWHNVKVNDLSVNAQMGAQKKKLCFYLSLKMWKTLCVSNVMLWYENGSVSLFCVCECIYSVFPKCLGDWSEAMCCVIKLIECDIEKGECKLTNKWW